MVDHILLLCPQLGVVESDFFRHCDQEMSQVLHHHLSISPESTP